LEVTKAKGTSIVEESINMISIRKVQTNEDPTVRTRKPKHVEIPHLVQRRTKITSGQKVESTKNRIRQLKIVDKCLEKQKEKFRHKDALKNVTNANMLLLAFRN
jgi:hypothetical protein